MLSNSSRDSLVRRATLRASFMAVAEVACILLDEGGSEGEVVVKGRRVRQSCHRLATATNVRTRRRR